MLKRSLHGTWRVWLRSSWTRPGSGEPLPPIRGYLSIDHRWWRPLTIQFFTAESSSTSIAAELSGDGEPVLTSIYRNDPRADVRERSPVHYGSFRMVFDSGDGQKMRGTYWTDRKSNGDMVAVKMDPRLARGYLEALGRDKGEPTQWFPPKHFREPAGIVGRSAAPADRLVDCRSYPWSSDVGKAVHGILCEAYQRNEEVEIVVDRAGIKLSSIDLKGSVKLVWRRVLNSAAKCGKLEALLKEVAEDEEVAAYRVDIERLAASSPGER